MAPAGRLGLEGRQAVVVGQGYPAAHPQPLAPAAAAAAAACAAAAASHRRRRAAAAGCPQAAQPGPGASRPGVRPAQARRAAQGLLDFAAACLDLRVKLPHQVFSSLPGMPHQPLLGLSFCAPACHKMRPGKSAMLAALFLLVLGDKSPAAAEAASASGPGVPGAAPAGGPSAAAAGAKLPLASAWPMGGPKGCVPHEAHEKDCIH